MAVSRFAEVTQLRYYLKDAANAFSDAQLSEILEQASGRVEAILLTNISGVNSFTFDATKMKHQVLREAALNWAALTCLGAPVSNLTLDYLYNAEDVFMNKYIHNVAILNDPMVAKWIVEA